MERPHQATLDCCGARIDRNAGIAGEFQRLFGASDRERLLNRYQAVGPPAPM